jgi:hypothetical protein
MKRTLFSVSSLLALSAFASAQIADFDTLVEGNYAPILADGGITFSNLVNGFGGAQNFCPEQADGTLTGTAGFTSPMTLGFGGWSPGNGAAFARCISFEMTTGQVVGSGGLEVYEFGSYAGNTITLEALSGATVVASQSITIPTGFAIHHYPFAVGGVSFDRMRLVGAGPQDSGAFFAVIDHVVMTASGPGSAYCFGDGTSGAACPCGNAGASGRGCENSVGTGGAVLTTAGTTNPDTIVLTSSGELPVAPSIFLQGTVSLATPVTFGDGLRCVGGILKRLYVEPASGGVVSAPEVSSGDPSITARSAALGDPLSPGMTRFYQVYYRDPDPVFCPTPTGNTWNVSNARTLTW